jgi:hypothetical protein
MQTVYKIFNPNTGTYVDADSVGSAKEMLAQQALEFYFMHTHQSPISIVEIDDNGIETWRNPASGETLEYSEYLAILNRLVNAT